jgi:hypothetical protein
VDNGSQTSSFYSSFLDKLEYTMNEYNKETLLRTKDCCTHSLLHVQQDALTHNKKKNGIYKFTHKTITIPTNHGFPYVISSVMHSIWAHTPYLQL